MNWIGGARARAKMQEQFNRTGNRRGGGRNVGGVLILSDGDDDEEEDEGNGGLDAGGVRQVPGEADDEVPRGRRRKRKSDNDGRAETYAPKSIDYAALGYRQVGPPKVQRRVVPLLEFLEKKIPNGEVLSLHLSHVLDITKTPNPGEGFRSQESQPPSSITSVSGGTPVRTSGRRPQPASPTSSITRTSTPSSVQPPPTSAPTSRTGSPTLSSVTPSTQCSTSYSTTESFEQIPNASCTT